MTARRRSRRGSDLGAAAFREWSAYWVGRDESVPPARELACEDGLYVVLAVPVAPEVVERFCRAHGNQGGLVFQVLPSLLLDERIWLGHWCVMAASDERQEGEGWG